MPADSNEAVNRAGPGGQHVDGRKRQVIADVQGCMFACHAHAANGHDGTVAAVHLLPNQPGWGQRFQSALTDNGHRGRFADHLQAMSLKS